MKFDGCEFCLPVFIHSYFLSDGHTEETDNATLTFFKYRDRYYAVTCLHVIDILNEKRRKLNNYWYTLSVNIEKMFLQLSDFDCSDPKKRKDIFRKLKKNIGEDEVDIVIAPIDSQWSLIKSKKSKKAIDLDSWVEPEWCQINMGSAFGYPTEHKYKKGNYVATPCKEICAELTSNLNSTSTQLTLFSALEKPHGYFFSGISGGPIFIPENDYYPIGIVYEGLPGSSEGFEDNQLDSQSIFSKNDILIKGLIVNPDIFSKWLEDAGL